jgi:L-threonylcarbamoyladenylate synthase
MKIIRAIDDNLNEIISALENGAVLVCPTDTVYGLVCDAMDEKAVEKIFKIKGREKNKPLPIFVRDLEMAMEFAEINNDQKYIIEKEWPGNKTYVLHAKGNKLSPLVYKEGTVAMRAPNYDLIKDIFSAHDGSHSAGERFSKPLAQTSANISGVSATTKIKEVIKKFERQSIQPDIIIDAGDLVENNPSTIIDLTDNNIKVIRK